MLVLTVTLELRDIPYYYYFMYFFIPTKWVQPKTRENELKIVWNNDNSYFLEIVDERSGLG